MYAFSAPRARNVIANLAARGQYHFTASELRQALGVSAAAARQALSRLAARGEIASPARGFYVIVPPEYRRLGCLPADQFIPALMERRNIRYYVGLLSAAQYHGAAHHRPQEFQVVLEANRPAIVCGSVRVAFVARRNLGAVPVESFNNPRGTVLVSTVEATAVDLVGYMRRAGGVDRVAGVLSELGEDMDPERLVEASRAAPIVWAQRLGYLLEHVGAADKAALLKEHVRKGARNSTRLLPGAGADGAPRSKDWRLFVNASVEGARRFEGDTVFGFPADEVFERRNDPSTRIVAGDPCPFHCFPYIHHMLKQFNVMKETDIRAVDAVRDLLGDVPNVEVESVDYERHVGSAYHVDAWIGLSYPGGSYALVVDVKPNGAPRFVRSGVHQLESCVARLRQSGEANGGRRLVPMLVSPYLSPESRAICTDHDVAYLDLVGNARLAFGTVYIERAVADKPRSETRALRSIFTPKAAAILRVLLRKPDRAWRVADLAAQANASYGHVSNVRKALQEREWLEVRDDGAVLVRPDALLKTWRESYRSPLGRSITGYTHLHGRQLDERLRGKLNPYPEHPRAIYSLHSAAQWLAPFSRSGTQTFYADEPGAEVLKEGLKLAPAARGANVVLHVPTDESLFDDASEPAPNVFCTSPIVTYLDLWKGNDREREAAEHLAGEFFPWLK